MALEFGKIRFTFKYKPFNVDSLPIYCPKKTESGCQKIAECEKTTQMFGHYEGVK